MTQRASGGRLVGLLLAVGLALGTAAQASSDLEAVSHGVSSLNGDAYADLVVGVPYEDVVAAADAGAVDVFYGRAGTLSAAGSQEWTQGVLSDLVEDFASSTDVFGSSLGLGDFNGDGHLDLAVGVPGETLEAGGVTDAGAVQVFYGSRTGLLAAADLFFHQNSTGVEGEAENGDGFGAALAGCDFDGDGYDDLAVGVPRDKVGTVSVVEAGAVQVFRGTASGLAPADDVVWHEDSVGIDGQAEEGDGFGSALVAADFNRDGYGDLAIGAPGQSAGAGAVHVLLGSSAGLKVTGALYWLQGSLGIDDVPEAGDGFGATLVAGDFDGDGYADLGIGVAGEDVAGLADAGALHILYGEPAGVTPERELWVTQDGMDTGHSEDGDGFGASMAAGDFDGDGYEDLAVGAPGGTLTVTAAGTVSVLYGSELGLAMAGVECWGQGDSGILEIAEEGDGFGYSLAVGDLNADAHADLIVGVPTEDLGIYPDVGVIHVIYGGPGGLSAVGNQLWQQGVNGVIGTGSLGDRFGTVLAALPRKAGVAYLALVLRGFHR